MWWILACASPADDKRLEGEEPGDSAVAPEGTEGELALAFSLDASGAGEDRVDSVELLDAAGTLELNGVGHAAIAYQDHDWAETGYHLYDLVSVAEDGSNLAVTYLYCAGEELPYAYTESFLHPMDWEVAHGTCDGTPTASVAAVSLPALSAEPTPIETGITFTSGEPADGVVTLDGVTRSIVPFNQVDCSDCPGGPWYELHTMLQGADDQCFAILYLYPDDPTFTTVEYTLCLPTLARPTGTVETEWTGALQGPPLPAGLLRPPVARPPRRRSAP